MTPIQTDQEIITVSKWLVSILLLAVMIVLGSGRLFGPRETDASLSSVLCAFAKGHFVYVGTPENDRCAWLIMTDSHGWVSSQLKGFSLEMRASWNAAQVKVDGHLFEIGSFHIPSDNVETKVYFR